MRLTSPQPATECLDPAGSTGSNLGSMAQALRRQGHGIFPDLLPVELLNAVLTRSRQIPNDAWHKAAVGRERQLDRRMRADTIAWLASDDAADASMLAWLEHFRLAMNRHLFLGLFDFEGHYAHYGIGARYGRHVDAFRGGTDRRLSFVLYLNPHWQPGHGGELALYGPSARSGVAAATAADPIVLVEPRLGTVVVFLSEEFPHEVRPALRPRYSLTGWFRVNAHSERRVDPPT